MRRVLVISLRTIRLLLLWWSCPRVLTEMYVLTTSLFVPSKMGSSPSTVTSCIFSDCPPDDPVKAGVPPGRRWIRWPASGTFLPEKSPHSPLDRIRFHNSSACGILALFSKTSIQTLPSRAPLWLSFDISGPFHHITARRGNASYSTPDTPDAILATNARMRR